MSPKALPARRLLFQPSHPPPIVVQVETLLARFVYNLIKIVYNLTELGFIIILWVIPGCQASFGKVADTLKISPEKLHHLHEGSSHSISSKA